uniref:Homing endonuclease LAGLIDADG domain-containing protein n=1 Tax=Cyberlindnera suaveolens TaxID=907738 RepID=S5TE69_9ASCO|nr:hypothetical protein H731WILSUA-C_029 [Cyberlindnera suaveolens]
MRGIIKLNQFSIYSYSFLSLNKKDLSLNNTINNLDKTSSGYNFNINEDDNENDLNIKKIINKYIKVIKDTKNSEHFKAWFSGFVSGDGSLQITKYNASRLAILLKKSELNTLKQINYHFDNKFNIFVNNYKYNTVTIHTASHHLLAFYVLPIFYKYPIITKKFYAYEEWRNNILDNLITGNREYGKILRSNYNLNTTLISNTSIPLDKLTISTILGFIEAEGSFYFNYENKTSKIELTITQNDTSQSTLEAIHYHILSWPINPKTPTIIRTEVINYMKSLQISLSSFKSKGKNKENTLNLRYLKIDFLYYVIVYNLEQLPWYTLKHTNFIIFKVALEILRRGLHTIPEGRNLLVKLRENLNKDNQIQDLPWTDIDLILSMTPIFNINLPIEVNAHSCRLEKKVGVEVYDLENNLVMFFTSQVKASKYFNIAKYHIQYHLDKDLIFQNKFYLRRPK